MKATGTISALHAVQVNDRAAQDLEIYVRELCEDIVFCVSSSQGMPAERAVQITGGQRIVLVQDAREDSETHE